MFRDNQTFWLTFREGLLIMLHAVELGLKSADALPGPTTSDIRTWWKATKKNQAIMVSMEKESEYGR